MTHAFFCPCIPPRATAQQKGVCLAGGRPMFYTKRKVQRTQDLFYGLFLAHRPPCPFNGPLRVVVVITFPWRKGETKANRARGWMPMPVKPDWDNLAKTPFDTLSKLSFWCDDGQVFDGRLIKGWGDRPGVRVSIEEVGSEDFSHLIGDAHE
jgi:Holliday junction resolvase RusA-like endonuclease